MKAKVIKIDRQVVPQATGNPVVERVDPARAEIWLRNSAPNRRVQPTVVDRYARDITAGRWVLNGETIKFDADGNLLDGQHRLAAIVKSGKAILTYVVRGLPGQVFATLDIGMRRTPGQLMAMASHADGNRLAAALSWLHKYRTNQMRSAGGRGSATPEELFALLGKEPKIEASVTWGGKMAKLRYGSLWVFIHYLLSKQDATMADLFMDALATGLNAKPGDPTYILRERLIENAGRRTGRMAPPDVYAITIRAWNAVRQGSTIKKVQVPRAGDFDLPDPV